MPVLPSDAAMTSAASPSCTCGSRGRRSPRRSQSHAVAIMSAVAMFVVHASALRAPFGPSAPWKATSAGSGETFAALSRFPVQKASKLNPASSRRSRSATMCASDGDRSDLEGTLQKELTAYGMRMAQFGRPGELLYTKNVAWVLIFNPEEDDEGVYTLQGRTDSRTYIVSFEARDEADRFANLLHADGFDLAIPTEWTTQQIESFCSTASFDLAFVPENTLMMPPSTNVYDTDAFQEMHDKVFQPKPTLPNSLWEQLHTAAIANARQRLEKAWIE